MNLGDAEIVRDTYRIENVGTWPAERITANDEERQRQGFELQTTFEWKGRDGGFDVRRGGAGDEHGPIATLAYGPGATITRLNKGLRRRADKSVLGFKIDPVSGYWAKNEDEADEPKDPTSSPRQWIVPSVQDRKNALLFQPIGADLSQSTLATIQHALLRGLETAFQLEEGEILAEPMPLRAARNGFLFYEATEGGAGVLTRLVSESATLARVARTALQIMHFNVDGAAGVLGGPTGLTDMPGTECVAACYRCLMSYFNQPDHELLDRRDGATREMLLRLARATTHLERATTSVHPRAIPEGLNPDVVRWFELADQRGLPRPDTEALTIGAVRLPLVWRGHYVAALRDKTEIDAREALEERGFEVVVFEGPDGTWSDAFARLATALGRAG